MQKKKKVLFLDTDKGINSYINVIYSSDVLTFTTCDRNTFSKASWLASQKI